MSSLPSTTWRHVFAGAIEAKQPEILILRQLPGEQLRLPMNTVCYARPLSGEDSRRRKR